MSLIKKVLIANRGEIAIRISQAAAELGISTVSIYPEDDASSLHIVKTDESVQIPGTGAQAYLDKLAVIEAAKELKVDAIHPGYGFLSENGDFAAAVEEAGLIFIGPCAETIRQMGDKAAAKTLMQAADVPVIPGQDGIVEENFSTVAENIGFPLLVKAAAGGGG